MQRDDWRTLLGLSALFAAGTLLASLLAAQGAVAFG